MRINLIIAVVLSGLMLFSCSEQTEKEKAEEEAKIKIVTTTGIIGDCIKNLVGNDAEVSSLMGPGVDPHLYKAVQGDLKLMEDADIIIYNGLHLEGKMADVLEKLSRIKPVFAVGNGLKESSLRSPEGYDAHDPHIWFNVKLWKQGLDYVSNEIAKTKPELAKTIENRKEDYFAKLDSLDAFARDSLATIPEEQRVLVTAHDAFGYFGDAYKIQVHGLQGLSTVSQAGIKDVTNLTELLMSRNIKAIFVESSIPKKQMEVILLNCRSMGHDLSIGGVLYSDAMGTENSDADTYVKMVKHNVTTIQNALK